MRRPDPARRYLAVKVMAAPPRHAIEEELFLHIRDKGDRVPASYALEIYTCDFEREIMQAWIASGADDAFIQQILEVPPTVTQAYRHLFFDMSVFRDRLDLLSWVRAYRQEPRSSKEGETLLQTAVMRGPKALAWIYGKEAVEIDSTEVLRHAMADAFFRGQANRQYSVSSKEAHDTHALMASAVKIAGVLDKKRPSDANALALKLKYREMTTPVVASQKSGEELLH